MIAVNDFKYATGIVNGIVNNDAHTLVSGQFSPEYKEQGVIPTALKIVHQAVKEGTRAQKKELSQSRHEIVALNSLLSQNCIDKRARELNIKMGPEVHGLQKMQIAIPQTTCEKMIEIATLIPRIVLSIISDMALLPVLAILLLGMLAKPNFDPVRPKTNAIPILLLHSSGFNESEWILGRLFLNKQQYGSVFSLNYDGLVTNDSKKGIDDYAAGKVRDKILQIKQLTGQDHMIVIGHSMGGLIGGYYAENFAKQDGVKIEHVMSIASPWRGSPLADRFMADPAAPKRYNQMRSGSPFRQKLVAKALHSERVGKINYYNIGSETDFLVPGLSSMLTEDPRRQRLFSYLGHDSIIVWPLVWGQIRTWLDGIYAKDPNHLTSIC